MVLVSVECIQLSGSYTPIEAFVARAQSAGHTVSTRDRRMFLDSFQHDVWIRKTDTWLKTVLCVSAKAFHRITKAGLSNPM